MYLMEKKYYRKRDNNFYLDKTKEEILSMGKNTPFIGMKLTGFPKLTMVNGKIVWQE